MIRTFLAVELNATLRAQLAQLQQDLRRQFSGELSKDARVSWVQPPSIHLTIKFLGDTDEALLEPMRSAIQQTVRPHLPLRIPLERMGIFPQAHQPKVLWVGPSELWERRDDARRLRALHQAVEAACRSFGFAPEGRPLSPHLTLARIKAGERRVGQALAKSAVLDRPVLLEALSVLTIAMMKSDLRPTGALYTPVWHC
jgi:RNA 2',3'-cyclic 3'-phosphodiesterase